MRCVSCGAEAPDATSEGKCQRCGAVPWLDGRYRLVRVASATQEHTEWLAFALDTPDLPVHIKALHLSRMGDLKALDRFEREAATLAQLQHPQLARYVEHFVTGHGERALACLVTEWVSGETLEAELKHRRYREAEVLALLAELTVVLADLHERTPPVVHRDLRPANVLRRASDQALVLVNFAFTRDGVGQATLTHSFTYGYAAPEQIGGEIIPKSDLYALGALGLELLTRRRPHTLPIGAVLPASAEAVDFWGGLEASLHPGTVRTLRELLAPAPEDRPRSAREAQARLTRVQRLVEEGRPRPVPLPPARPRRWIRALFVALVLLVAGGLWMVGRTGPDEFSARPYELVLHGRTITGFLEEGYVQIKWEPNIDLTSLLWLSRISRATRVQHSRAYAFRVEGDGLSGVISFSPGTVFVVRTAVGDVRARPDEIHGFTRL